VAELEPGELESGAPARATIQTRADADGTPVVTVAGELDISNAHELQDAAAAVAQTDPERVVFELSGTRFMDSAALAVLLRLAAQVPSVHLRNPSAAVRRVVELTGLRGVLHIEQ
jgi:anti-sigma B factor antagonist